MEKIVLNCIEKKKNKIIYHYQITEKLKEFINIDNQFYIEYEEEIIEKLPDSILNIPFLCNFLPIAWITDAKIEIDEIDETFYNSIPEFKKGYIEMYPQINFKGEVQYKNKVKNIYETGEKVGTFFSGGVDASSTLVTHLKENPITITLWGADIKTDNIDGWNTTKKFIQDNTPHITNRFIKSTFREILIHDKLNKLILKYVNENWWHGFQHGLGLIGNAAPLAYIYKMGKVYIPSTFTEKDKGVTCASDPTIDNHVRFASCRIIHDGYEYTRQQKIKNICNFNEKSNYKIKLRVCYMSDTGKNCNECEKCIRTIIGIIAEGGNPTEYGFNPDYQYIKDFLLHKCYFDKVIYPLWNDILQELKENKSNIKNIEKINWIYKEFDMDKINKSYRRLDKRIIRYIKRKVISKL